MGREQLALVPSSSGRADPPQVWETTFVGGPEDGKMHRLVDAPERWAVYRHRQAIGVSEIRAVHEPRLQSSLWERHLYERVYESEGRATYRPVLPEAA